MILRGHLKYHLIKPIKLLDSLFLVTATAV
jgi:hypothetical protein